VTQETSGILIGVFIYCDLKNAWKDLQDLHLKILDFHHLSLDFYLIFLYQSHDIVMDCHSGTSLHCY
jgi:hypothetical protein